MASPIIKVKRSETAAAVPTLTYGELGVNITDKKIFVGNSSSVATLIVDGNASGVSLSASNAFTGANTFTNATGQTINYSNAAQDGIILQGRNGGTGSFDVTIVPTTLTANRTIILPNTSGTFVTTGDSATIQNTMLADMQPGTLKGRTAGIQGVPLDLTGAQVTTFLSEFTSSEKGVAPASGGGTTTFLRADGNWSTPTAAPNYGTALASAYGMFMP
jgi:hypothetical protein